MYMLLSVNNDFCGVLTKQDIDYVKIALHNYLQDSELLYFIHMLHGKFGGSVDHYRMQFVVHKILTTSQTNLLWSQRLIMVVLLILIA